MLLYVRIEHLTKPVLKMKALDYSLRLCLAIFMAFRNIYGSKFADSQHRVIFHAGV